MHEESKVLHPKDEKGESETHPLLVLFDNDAVVGMGLKAVMESIDSRSDFKVWMDTYALAHSAQNPRGPRRTGPAEEGYVRSRLLPIIYN